MTGFAPSRRRDDPGPPHPERRAVGRGESPRLLRALWAFGGISGLGWCLDTAVFVALVYGVGLAPGRSNVISAGLAVVFVFLCSHESVFAGKRRSRYQHLTLYAICQVVLVLAASWLVSILVTTTRGEPWVVKAAITPLTFAANFVVMSMITRVRTPRCECDPA
ncbi:MAG: GtrA family protein [Actinomycetota bacterium]|nr:GtrA family protein [Actinomycetota bacterium]